MTHIFESVPSQEKRLNEPFVWLNTASVENIPEGVKPVVDDVVDAIHQIYGHNGAFYIHGSTVAGGFRKGSSDIDGIWFAYGDIPEDHRERRIEALSAVDTREEVGYLDIIAMPVSEIGDMDRKSQVFACAFNGVKVSGDRDIDFTGKIPETIGDYFSCQYARFGFIVELCRAGYDIDSLENRSPRSLAKALSRAIFHEAFLRGCAYEQNSRKMHRTLLDCGYPAEADEFERYLLMSQSTMDEEDKFQVFTRAANFVPIFDQIVHSNTSPYGEKVKAWLSTLG